MALSVYVQLGQYSPEVVGVVAVSPGKYHHDTIVCCRGEAFLTSFALGDGQFARGDIDPFNMLGVPWASTGLLGDLH